MGTVRLNNKSKYNHISSQKQPTLLTMFKGEMIWSSFIALQLQNY